MCTKYGRTCKGIAYVFDNFCLFRRVGTLTNSTCNSSFCIMDAHEYAATDVGCIHTRTGKVTGRSRNLYTHVDLLHNSSYHLSSLIAFFNDTLLK